MIKVHGKPIRVNKASQDKKQLDVGANLFIGNIDPDVDEKARALQSPAFLQCSPAAASQQCTGTEHSQAGCTMRSLTCDGGREGLAFFPSDQFGRQARGQMHRASPACMHAWALG